MAQVRTAALTNYFEVARFVGLDPLRMLKRARINPAMLADPDRWIARSSVNFLLTESARKANCQSFGLMMAEGRSLSHLGAIALLLRHQQTVRDAVLALSRYQYLIGDTVVVSLKNEGALVAIRIDVLPSDRTIERQGIELVLGILFKAFVAVSGDKWRAERVHFNHAAPADPVIHERLFRCPLVFASDFHGFVCTPESLDMPTALADAEMARYAASYLDTLTPDAQDGSIEQRVRRSLDLMMPLGRATLEQVAENLGMPARTLQRLLEKDGTSFGGLLGAVRRELVLDYLTNSNHSLGEIARMAGYATPSSFNRWFYSEFGLTPGAWRAGERPPEPDYPSVSLSAGPETFRDARAH